MSVLDAAGPQAARLASLWWLMFWVCAVVTLLVLAALAFAVVRGRRRAVQDAPMPSPPAAVGAGSIVAVATVITTITLVGLLVASVTTGRAISALTGPDSITIELTGHQWWWEARYADGEPWRRFLTANELHVPVGRPVDVKLKTADVIHSLWVPSLQGKRDLIPARTNELVFQADRAGVFGGQCAEFCGLQHAHMAIRIVAESSDRFDRWRDMQIQPAPEPTDALARRGRDAFVAGPCALCHTVRGTPAGGAVGPDLTHVASRATLASGTIPNTPGHLGGWIADAQGIKPGTQMPTMGLPPEELLAILAWLRTLR
jgi:cytochrome c oxidase subunit II